MEDLIPDVQVAVEKINRLAYSPAEAGAVLGISRASIYNLMASGTIHSVSLGRRRLITHDELVRVLQGDEG